MTETSKLLSAGLDGLQQGMVARSFTQFKAVLNSEPEHPIALYGLGLCLIRQDKSQEAISCLTRASARLPQTASAGFVGEVFLALGLAHRNLGHEKACDHCYRIALLMRPADAQAWFNLANVQADSGRKTAAVQSCRYSLFCRPDWSDGWNNLGRLENNREHLDVAMMAYQRALAVEPAHRFAWNNLGIVGKKQDDLASAIASFEHAVICNPDQPDAWANLGRNLLLTEQFARGWAALGHTWRQRGFAPEGGWFKHPVWDGSKILDGKALLVWCSDKIGDEVLYTSFLPEVLERACRVIFLANPRLEKILSRSFPEVEIVPWDQQSPPRYNSDDVAAFYPLDFIGEHVVQNREDISPARALLKADETLVEEYRDRADRRLRIGLCWHTDNNVIGSYRTQRLADWQAILEVPNTRFFSLQYGDHQAELDDVVDRFGVPVETPQGVDQLTDMEGFAAFVSSLDLVISIPSTTVHVAGAIGTPSWVMLPTGPGLSWFWFLGDDRSRWYPDVRAFRQHDVGQWEPVIKEVASVLREQIKSWGLKGRI